MKTGKILLTALASLALSTAAYANDANDVNEKVMVQVPNWVPQTPLAGQATYINLCEYYDDENVQEPVLTNTFLGNLVNGTPIPMPFDKYRTNYELIYHNLSQVSQPDKDTWMEYGLDAKKHVKEYYVVTDVDFNPGKKPHLDVDVVCKKHFPWVDIDIKWEPGQKPSVTPSYGTIKDRWFTYQLTEQQNGETSYIPSELNTHNPQTGSIYNTNEILLSKPAKNGTYLINVIGGKERSLNWIPVAFINQAQYEFHVTAAKAADYLNASPYRGSVFNELKRAIETQGVNWEVQKANIENLLAQFKKDEARVHAALDALPATIELGTIAINGVAKNTFNLDLPAVNNQEFRFTDYVTLSTTSDYFTVDKATVFYYEPNAVLTFAPVDPEFNFEYRMPSVEYLTINVMGITKEIELIGRNPEMSWTLNELTEEQTISFIERGTLTVPFYTFGYDGMYENGADGVFHEKDVTITQIEGATDEYYIELQKVDAPYEDFGALNFDEERKPMHGVRAYQLIVKFNGNKIGANDAVFEIADHFTGNKIQLNIKAAQVALGVTDLKGNAIDQIDFPEEGGEKIIAVHYAGFQSTDEIQRIATAFNYPFTAEFVSAPEGETSSNRVEGTGTVYLKISCAPAFDGPQYPEFEILEANGTISFGKEAVVTIPLTRTKTLLSTKGVNHYDTEIEMGGEKFESEIEFAAIDFVNYYSLDDIRIYTDVDVFIINDVIRWHKGSMKDGNFDTLGTVALNYRPNHADVITRGNLYIENIKNGKKIIIPLVGLATSQAKINELNGTTGIETIEAEGAAQNGEMFNVAGQRVNGAAKGLVIKNGKKFIVK